MSQIKRPPLYKLNLLQLIFWPSMSMYFMSALILKEYGYNVVETGILLSVIAAFVIVSQNIAGYFCDLKKSSRLVYIVCSTMAFILGFSTYLLRETSFFTVSFISTLFFLAAQFPIVDVFTMNSIADKKNYGIIRAFGSFSFAVFMACSVFIIKSFGVFSILLIGSLFSFATLIILASSPKDCYDVKQNDNKEKLNPLLLLRNKKVLILLFAVFFFAIGMRTIGNFLPSILEAIGQSGNLQGGITAPKVFLEIPAFIITAWFIKKYGSTKMLLVSFAANFIMFILMAYSSTIFGLGFAYIFDAIGFPFYCTGKIFILRQITEMKYQGTALAMLNSIDNGVSAIVGNAASGLIVATFGVKSYLFTMAFLIFLAILLLIALNIILKREKQGGNRF